MDENNLLNNGCGCGEHHHHHHEEEGCCGGSCGGHEEEHSCGCGCGGHEEEALFLPLQDEDGNEILCEIVEGFEFEDKEYALAQNPNDGSVYLFRIVEDEEGLAYEVPEEKEFNEAVAYFESLKASDL